MTFGQRLYELRKNKNLTQEQLAELLEVSRQSVSKWEQDKAYPEMTRLIFLSDYFEVSLDYLMRGTEQNAESGSELEQNSYQAENLLLVWQTFLSNLNPKQKQIFILISVLVIIILVLLIIILIYSIGEGFGKFLYHVTH